MSNLKKSIVIVANGDFPYHPKPLKVLSSASTILACDGAADTLIKNKYIPDIVIGDLDSISKQTKEKYSKIIIEAKDQSENDLRKAINYSIDKGFNTISIIGATGKREDHTIGNIFSLLNYNKLNIKIFTDTGLFRVVENGQDINSFKGQNISIFSTDKTIKLTTNYLKYNFNKSIISTIFKGTLNKSIKDKITFKLSHGYILLFQEYKTL
tara:strand:+ start:3242 stop:3874 length:633 start_codon:yes stop_codon:yes gene_type:complete